MREEPFLVDSLQQLVGVHLANVHPVEPVQFDQIKDRGSGGDLLDVELLLKSIEVKDLLPIGG